MVCKNKWLERAKELEKMTQTSPASVDGAARCIKCERPLRKDGSCVLGHAQEERPAVLTMPEELEAMLCLADELESQDIFTSGAADAVQAAREFQSRPAGESETDYYEEGSRLAQALLAELVDPARERKQLEADPRVQVARSLIDQRQGPGGAGQGVLESYIASKSDKPYKPKTDLDERWATRIVPNGWYDEAGAEAYLGRFGKGISADKCIGLARHAEHMGFPDLARGFWRRAYELENGHPAPNVGPAAPVQAAPVRAAFATPAAAPVAAPPAAPSVLGAYMAGKSSKPFRPKQDIAERWVTRIVPNGWQHQGEAGAAAYLRAYGKGISADKCIALARHAESEGFPDLARGFWKRAYELENGHPAPDNGPTATASGSPNQAAPAPRAVLAVPAVAGLPDNFQPGRFVTMQPVDAPQSREAYINDPAWWGQPKRDGEKRTVHAGDTVVYQARSLNIREAPSPEIDQALAQVARARGPFVLEGEVYYLDARDGEHRSAAQAVSANLKSGHAGEPPRTRYAIFKALFADGQDLTGRPESERIAAGEEIGRALAALTDEVEVLPTARTAEEKAALADMQESEGREGEVWMRPDCTYAGGKAPAKKSGIVRTKYIPEADVVVMGLTASTAAGRPFGAIQVGMYDKARGEVVPVGSIGTGFTREQMDEIAQAHAANPGQVVITVGSQGQTESGRLWQGRYHGLRADKKPEECERT